MTLPRLAYGFTGSRAGMTAAQRAAVHRLLGALDADEWHHGNAVGCDADFARLVLARGRMGSGGQWRPALVAHPCDIASQQVRPPLGDLALPALPPRERNRAIVGAAAAGLIACVAGAEDDPACRRSGTWQTVRMARRAGRRLWVVYPDGEVREEEGHARADG